MVIVLGESAPSYTMIKKWFALFKHDCTDFNDDPRLGHSRIATNPEIIDYVCVVYIRTRFRYLLPIQKITLCCRYSEQIILQGYGHSMSIYYVNILT